MKLVIGSTNVIKIQAVQEVIQNYSQLIHAQIVSCSVPSGVPEQPLSLEEIIRGAKNRACNAYKAVINSTYSFGIESGLFRAEGVQTGFLEACICCIFDGADYHIGLSSGFEVPPPILKLILHEQMDLGQACHRSGVTDNPQLGAAEGLIGILTKNRINRKEYTKQAVTTALIRLENELLFEGEASSVQRHD